MNAGVDVNGFKYRYIKRLLDFFLTVVGSIGIFPVLFILYVLIKIDSPGNAFYIDYRIGKDGKLFQCYKFRSMHINSDEILQKFLSKNPEYQKEWDTFAKLRTVDPRVTNVGLWMRKYSLDELPQIFNVLKGEMSLVCPRPYLPREKEAIGEYYLPIITAVLPGITGLWQVSGRNDISFQGRLAMDEQYVRTWDLWNDVEILYKTVSVVIRKKGAY